MRFINKQTLRQDSNTACTVKSFRQLKAILLRWEHHSYVFTCFIPQTRQETGSVNRLMGTSVVVLLKISFSIIRCRQIHCYLKAKFPRQLNYFRRLFFLVVNGFLRLCSWYPEKDILFKWSNQNMYIKFSNKMTGGKQTIQRLRGWRRELTIIG